MAAALVAPSKLPLAADVACDVLAADRLLRQRILEKAFIEAQSKVDVSSRTYVRHGRIALAGISALMAVRALAWWKGSIPGYYVFGMHFVAFCADLCCAIFALPLFFGGAGGRCVDIGCVGPVLTLVFAMSVIDVGALVAFLLMAAPRPLAPGSRSYIDVMQAMMGSWDFVLVASVALELALCASSWRVYKELRVAGLYPPGSNPAKPPKVEEVSLMEMVCEAEDLKAWKEWDCTGNPCAAGDAQRVPAGAESA